MPTRSLRHALRMLNIPNGTEGTPTNARASIAAATRSCSPSLPAASHSAVIASMAGSEYHPNHPAAPCPRISALVAGVATEMALHHVWNTLHPPFSTLSRLARRCSTVPQSVSASSTAIPISFSNAAVICPNGAMVGKSTG